MKLWFATFLTIFGLASAYAGGITSSGDEALPAMVSQDEAINIANVFIDNPKLVEQLGKEGLSVVNYKAHTDNPGGLGVTEFTFRLARVCECFPKSGTLNVIQDRRPLGRDDFTEYKIDLQIDKED